GEGATRAFRQRGKRACQGVAARSEVTRQALSRGESVWGMHAVAVPPAGSSWRDRLALMASAPVDRSDEAALVRRAEKLRQSASLLGSNGRAPGGARADRPPRHP
ncbi:hypothetical protein ACWD6R_02950, partial [Streptomyces sp. NPDC005151]